MKKVLELHSPLFRKSPQVRLADLFQSNLAAGFGSFKTLKKHKQILWHFKCTQIHRKKKKTYWTSIALAHFLFNSKWHTLFLMYLFLSICPFVFWLHPVFLFHPRPRRSTKSSKSFKFCRLIEPKSTCCLRQPVVGWRNPCLISWCFFWYMDGSGW